MLDDQPAVLAGLDHLSLPRLLIGPQTIEEVLEPQLQFASCRGPTNQAS